MPARWRAGGAGGGAIRRRTAGRRRRPSSCAASRPGYGPLPGAVRRRPRGPASVAPWRWSGANGAGKTTVARVATGLVRPTAGTVHVEGRGAHGGPHRSASPGPACMHVAEGRSVFAPLTVEENLRLGHRGGAGRAGPRRSSGPTRSSPARPDAGRQLAGTLSGGEQRMLSLATAIVRRARRARGRRAVARARRRR